jgi:HEAT repeat protein
VAGGVMAAGGATTGTRRGGGAGRRAPLSGALLALLAALLVAGGCGRVEKEKPIAAVIAAAKVGDGAATRDLVRRFAHPDPVIAEQAWDAVVALGAAAEPALIEGLSSADPTVAEFCAGALGGRGAKAALEPLTKALKSWSRRRYVAAWALGEIGDPSAIPALIAALGDQDPEVGKYAARSLIKFGKEATDALLKALDSPAAATRHYAMRALGEIQDPRSADAMIAASGKVDRVVHLWALGRLGDKRGFETVAAAVTDPDRNTRLAAIQALNDLGDARAIPVLTRALEDPEWMIREWAARGLESITGDRHRYRNQHGDEVYPYSLYR